jgi:hypothetical protein
MWKGAYGGGASHCPHASPPAEDERARALVGERRGREGHGSRGPKNSAGAEVASAPAERDRVR